MEHNPLFGIKARKMRTTEAVGDARTNRIPDTYECMDLFSPGQRLFFWIGQAAKLQRERAGLKLEPVADASQHSKETLDHFEKGARRPQNLEQVLVGYAKATGLDDPRDIVAEGVQLWYREGTNPADTPPDTLPGADAATG